MRSEKIWRLSRGIERISQELSILVGESELREALVEDWGEVGVGEIWRGEWAWVEKLEVVVWVE